MSGLCCYVADQGKLKAGCRNRAEYQVRIGGAALGNYIESCAEHLGEMLGGHDRFEVFRIYYSEDVGIEPSLEEVA